MIAGHYTYPPHRRIQMDQKVIKRLSVESCPSGIRPHIGRWAWRSGNAAFCAFSCIEISRAHDQGPGGGAAGARPGPVAGPGTRWPGSDPRPGTPGRRRKPCPWRSRGRRSSLRPPAPERVARLHLRDLLNEKLVVHGDLAHPGAQPINLFVTHIVRAVLQSGCARPRKTSRQPLTSAAVASIPRATNSMSSPRNTRRTASRLRAAVCLRRRADQPSSVPS